MQKEIGDNISRDSIKEYLWKTLKSGQVVPGSISCFALQCTGAHWLMPSYGHGVLRNPDPRFIALQEFCNSRSELKDSSIIQLVNMVSSRRSSSSCFLQLKFLQTSQVAPDVLKEHGKVCGRWTFLPM